MIAYIWPDGTWCWAYELSEMAHMSDDFLPYECDEATTAEDVDLVAFHVQQTGVLP